MKKASGKDSSHEVQSKVFSKAEVEAFKRVFEKLAKGGQTISLQAYVKHMRDLTKARDDAIIKMIIADLENDGEERVNFKQFVGIMEEKVGDLESTTGVQKLFGYIANDPLKQIVTIEDLRRLRADLGLQVSEQDLQRLVDFVTVSFKQRSNFTYEEFENYVLK